MTTRLSTLSVETSVFFRLLMRARGRRRCARGESGGAGGRGGGPRGATSKDLVERFRDRLSRRAEGRNDRGDHADDERENQSAHDHRRRDREGAEWTERRASGR